MRAAEGVDRELHVMQVVVEVERGAHSAGPHGGPDRGGRESLGGIGGVHGDDRGLLRRSVEPGEEGVGQADIMAADALRIDGGQQFQGVRSTYPAEPRRGDVQATCVLGQPKRQTVDRVPDVLARIPTGGARRQVRLDNRSGRTDRNATPRGQSSHL